VNQFKAIPGGCQHDGVITDHIAAADGMDADLAASTLAGHPDAPVAGILFVIKAISLIKDLDKATGCAAGGILFEAVMHFDNLGIIIGPKDFSSLLGEPEEGVDPDAIVGGEDHGNSLGCL
jgi:hypothetical protein